jgi:PTH1 family peptidyl-tRNA hydrolase
MNYLIVGLGNPGTEYEKTRHNAGWIVIDNIFPQAQWIQNSYAQAQVSKILGPTHIHALVKPSTFMNLSGESVSYFVNKEGVLPENVIVIYDDVDMPLGKLKISFDRGSGGHNGIKSIEAHLGSRQFIRIRIGISKILEDGTFVKPNVLGKFEPAELETLNAVSKKVKEGIEMILKEGKEKAMSIYNTQ